MMTTSTETKAVLIGVAVLVFGNALWLAVLSDVRYSELLRLVLLTFPGVSAFLVAYLAPRRNVMLGISMAFWGAIIGTLTTAIYEHFGVVVDSVGAPMTLFFVLLGYQLISCTIGSAAGYLLFHLSKKRNKRENGYEMESRTK